MANHVTKAIRKQREELLSKGLKVCSRSTCSSHGMPQVVDNFYKSHRLRDGLTSECKECTISTVRIYQQTPEGRAINRKAVSKFGRSENGKERAAAHKKSDKGKLQQLSYRTRHAEERKARNAVNNAVKRGVLQPANMQLCECGNPAIEHHHHLGYAKDNWLRVVAVCKTCHVIFHSMTSALGRAIEEPFPAPLSFRQVGEQHQ